MVLKTPTSVHVELQIADNITAQLTNDLPSVDDFSAWLNSMLSEIAKHPNTKTASDLELGIRIVGLEESRQLNYQFRKIDKATNVLSFESDLPDYIPSNFIGDLVICQAVVVSESQQQSKNVKHHWAHMCIHGCLHLLGYDHINDDDARVMEALEVKILAKLGIDDPYQNS